MSEELNAKARKRYAYNELKYHGRIVTPRGSRNMSEQDDKLKEAALTKDDLLKAMERIESGIAAEVERWDTLATKGATMEEEAERVAYIRAADAMGFPDAAKVILTTRELPIFKDLMRFLKYAFLAGAAYERERNLDRYAEGVEDGIAVEQENQAKRVCGGCGHYGVVDRDSGAVCKIGVDYPGDWCDFGCVLFKPEDEHA